MTELKPCYKCNGETYIYVHSQVRGETPSYAVVCKVGCGQLENNLPSTGGYRDKAIREYNRIYKQKILATSKTNTKLTRKRVER